MLHCLYRMPSVPIHTYEMVDISSQAKSSHASGKSNSTIGKTVTKENLEQAEEYQVPVAGDDGKNRYRNPSDARIMKSNEEDNTYQPLIPPRPIIGNESREYQSLTLPKQLNVAPSLPPKPGTNRAVNRAQSSVQRGWKDNY